MYVADPLYEDAVQALGQSWLWRYMGLDQLVGLLATGRLWLSCMTTMEDQTEGLHFDSGIGDTEFLIAQRYRIESPMSCWSASTDESLPMWKSCTDDAAGVVLRSDANAMRKSLGNQDHDNVFLGVVRYVKNRMPLSRVIDGDSYHVFSDALFYKDSAFAYEGEARLVSRAFVDKPAPSYLDKLNTAPTPRTQGVPVDLHDLIHEVRVTPFAEPWLRDAVRGLMDAFGLKDKPVRDSGLREIFASAPPCVDVPQFAAVPPGQPNPPPGERLPPSLRHVVERTRPKR